MRKHKSKINANGKRVFVKEYSFKDLLSLDISQMEYEKGLKINKIIPYPKPLECKENKIYYEFIDIKYSLWEKMVFSRDRVTKQEFERVGKYLRKMHDNDIMHGDFGPSNVVFDKQGKLYFIDASFSHHNTGGKVLWKVEDIYQDISLFLMHLDISKPFWKPWLFLKLREKEVLKKAFLMGYFKKPEEFDPIKNCQKEIQFLNLHLEYLQKKCWKAYFLPLFFIASLFLLIKKIQLKKLSKSHN